MTIHKIHALSLTTVTRESLNRKCVRPEHTRTRPGHVTLETVTRVRPVISARTMVRISHSRVQTARIAPTEQYTLSGARLVFTVLKLELKSHVRVVITVRMRLLIRFRAQPDITVQVLMIVR